MRTIATLGLLLLAAPAAAQEAWHPDCPEGIAVPSDGSTVAAFRALPPRARAEAVEAFLADLSADVLPALPPACGAYYAACVEQSPALPQLVGDWVAWDREDVPPAGAGPVDPLPDDARVAMLAVTNRYCLGTLIK